MIFFKKIFAISSFAVYTLCPFDILPDAIPIGGFIDEFLLLGLVVYFLKNGRFPNFFNQWGKIFYWNHSSFEKQEEFKNNYEENHQNKNQVSQDDPYEILGINQGASQSEIRKAYLLAAQKYHPDKVEHLGKDLQKIAQDKFIQIQEAYTILSNK